jgi:hypothetical protein
MTVMLMTINCPFNMPNPNPAYIRRKQLEVKHLFDAARVVGAPTILAERARKHLSNIRVGQQRM